jgi:SRSO17 transposase
MTRDGRTRSVIDSQCAGTTVTFRAPRFARPESRRRVRDFVGGLLAPLPVKNCWTIAEHAGDDSPGEMQDLIGRASWDDASVRADVRDFVAARLGHAKRGPGRGRDR